MDKQRKNRKINSSSFLKYFISNIPVRELSDSDIREYIKKWETSKNVLEEIKKTFQDLKKKDKIGELLNKLKQVYIDDLKPKTVKGLIEYIYKHIDKFSEANISGLFDSESDRAGSLVMWLINNHYKKATIENELINVIIDTPSYYYKVYITLFCKRERGELYNIYESIQLTEIFAKTSELLKKHYVNDKNNVFDEYPNRKWSFILYQWAMNWDTPNDGKNAKVVNDYVISIIKKDYEKFILFLENQSRNNPQLDSDIHNFEIPMISKIYDLEELKLIADEFIQRPNITSYERSLMSQFILQTSLYIAQEKKKQAG